MSIAFVFPGQGSHRAGALGSWTSHPASAVLTEVSEGLGRDVIALSEDPSAGARTADAQPAIMAASLVAWRAATDAGVEPAFVAGHSLGEYTAAIAAGTLSVADGSALVAARGTAMGAACAANPGTMAALLKLEPAAVTQLVDAIDGLVVANDNAPGQVVVAGPPAAIEAVREQARAAGGRAVPLEVEGAFHSPAMAPAVDAVRAQLATASLADPAVALISGSTAMVVREANDVARGLVDGILAPVRWREVQLALADVGVDTLIELGPGGVLAGLARRTVPDLRAVSVATPDELDAALATL